MRADKRLLTLKDAAEELGLAQVTLRTWAAGRKIAVVRLGRAVRIPVAEIERLISDGLVPAVRR
jgi:excisionase family DNA binding protein